MKAQVVSVRAELTSRVPAGQHRLAVARSPAEVSNEVSNETPALFADIARLAGVIKGGKGAPMLQQSAAQGLVDSRFA